MFGVDASISFLLLSLLQTGSISASSPQSGGGGGEEHEEVWSRSQCCGFRYQSFLTLLARGDLRRTSSSSFWRTERLKSLTALHEEPSASSCSYTAGELNVSTWKPDSSFVKAQTKTLFLNERKKKDKARSCALAGRQGAPEGSGRPDPQFSSSHLNSAALSWFFTQLKLQ